MRSQSRTKSRMQVLDRRARLAVRQAERLWAWALRPGAWPTPALSARPDELPVLLTELRQPIGRSHAAAQPLFEAGKRHNVALAAPFFDGLEIAPERPLSFWRTLGRVTAARGFADGMELRGGCVVPSVGGGICLLSNALYELAARAGFAILERHGHSIEAVPDAPALDATVLWPHIDLRFAPRSGRGRLSVRVEADELVLAAYAARAPEERFELAVVDERLETTGDERIRHARIVRQARDAATGALGAAEEIGRNRRRLLHAEEIGRSCLSCGETECHDRVVPRAPLVALGRR
jgi:vancomycin resistance protein VanW